MNPDQNRIEKLAREALELPAGAVRDKWIAGQCGDDDALRQSVADLVSALSDVTIVSPGRGRQALEPNIASSAPATHGTGSGTRNGRALVLEPEEVNSLLEAYDVQELLGRGGMGSVYGGTQISLERKVAIKILPPESGEDPDFAERFRREALSMARMDHPNIVTIYDFGSAEIPDGRTLFFIAMEFVSGTDLQKLISTGKLPEESALDVISQICDALHYAHGQGYVHRDIKPANIFVSDQGTVKIGDFGLAKLLGSDAAESAQLTASGFVMGTPFYMAPEGFEGAKIDHRSDIYSLGVMFYQMLTGSLPKANSKPPSEKSGVDSRLDAIVNKAMEEEPELRYQDANEVKADVTKVLTTRARIRATGGRRDQRSARKPAWVWAVGFGVLAVAITMILLSVIHPEPPTPPVPSPDKKLLPAGSAHAPFGAKEAENFQRDWAERLGVGVRSTNSIGIQMVLIPPGSFRLGSSSDEIARAVAEAEELGLGGRYAEYIRSEGPSRDAFVREPFLLAATEVTVGQFRQFVTESNYRTTAETNGVGGYGLVSRQQKPDYTWSDPDFPQTGDHPVVEITLTDAENFCEWLSGKEGVNYFLPTDIQWEYACRAGTESRWSFGETPDQIGDFAWYDGNSGNSTQPVGTKTPNPFGLHDMHGNVREWCARIATSPDTGILRGGAFPKPPLLLRSSQRIGFRMATPYPYHGFRVASEVKANP